MSAHADDAGGGHVAVAEQPGVARSQPTAHHAAHHGRFRQAGVEVLDEQVRRECVRVRALPVQAASQRLDTTTLFGRFHLDPVTGVQTGHQIRVVQWRGGQRLLVDRPLRRT
jgi:hypothetical protein